MEPRPEGRGDKARNAPVVQATWLQWSHGPKAVETGRRLVAVVSQGRASMEPRPEGRGDGVNPYRFSNVGLASMEPRPEGRGDGADVSGFIDSSHSLQWSHGPKAMETPSGVPNLTRTVGRFNGATARRPWRPSRGRTCP